MTSLPTIGEYGARIDPIADSFLVQDGSDLYGMLRYFMGYLDKGLETRTRSVGKRLRPGLLLLIAEGYGAVEGALPAALSIELFHNFTLIHDDIEDHDEMRRGRPTLWKEWGINKALNAGDAQAILAFRALREGNVLEESKYAELERFLLTQYAKVIEGQHLDFVLSESNLRDAGTTLPNYMTMIGKKCAELIAASTRAAGIIGGCSDAEKHSLYTFGYELGIAYQLLDDYRSIWATSEETGKQACGDIVERKKTFPILHTRETLALEDRETFVRTYEDPMSSTEEILAWVVTSGAQQELSARIQKHKTDALAAVTELTIGAEYRAALHDAVACLIP